MPLCHKPECTMFDMSCVIFLANHSVRKVETNKTSSAPPNPSCLSLSHPIPPARAAHKSFFSFVLPISLLFSSDHLLSQFCTFFRFYCVACSLSLYSTLSPVILNRVYSDLTFWLALKTSCLYSPLVEESQTRIMISFEISLGFCLGNRLKAYSLL